MASLSRFEPDEPLKARYEIMETRLQVRPLLGRMLGVLLCPPWHSRLYQPDIWIITRQYMLSQVVRRRLNRPLTLAEKV